MSSSGMSSEKTESYVHGSCHPDNAYANMQISGVQYATDRESVQILLRQTCL